MSGPSSFAEFLPDLIGARTARGWSRGHLGRLIGLTDSAIESWERGRRVPAEENAHRWADALELQMPADTTGWFSKRTRHRVPPHGTRSGAQKHRRDGERVCLDCLRGEAVYVAERRAVKGRAKSPGQDSNPH